MANGLAIRDRAQFSAYLQPIFLFRRLQSIPGGIRQPFPLSRAAAILDHVTRSSNHRNLLQEFLNL
jgi:hypothetical protein